MSKQLAELLARDKLITPGQLNEAVEACKSGKSYARYLIEKKHLSENKLLYYLSHKFGLPSINLTKFEISPEVIKLFSADLVKKSHSLPIQVNSGTVVVAMADPTQMSALENIQFILKMNVEAVLTSFTAFDAAVYKCYGGSAAVGTAIESFKKDRKALSEDVMALELVQIHNIDTASAEQDAPVITLVNGILSEAIRRSVSDIHIEPYEEHFRIRMRIDGTLYEVAEIPLEMKRAVTARVKIMARMDIAETRVPQDGRIKLKISGNEIDFRVSTMPTLFGEKVALRMLNRINLQLDLLKLGFEPQQLDVFKKGVYTPYGMILVTGPTGSGKTTTLYSTLTELNKITDNLSTVEDPIEYNLHGINQVQVHKEIGLTFASVLRSLLRQDPDIILVGEIRDFETAEVSIQAALTGHLVLSTLHTNDAPSTIVRLMNMGIEPFLVVASLNTIVAQRLLRTICKECMTEQAIPAEKLIALGLVNEKGQPIPCYKGLGCASCSKSGYKGRVAVYEVMDFSSTLKEMVLKGENIIEIKRQAVQEGMKSLRASALTKVREGRTTLEEAISITMAL